MSFHLHSTKLSGKNEIFTLENPTSPETESVKISASNILFSSPNELKSIMVSSSGPSEGKTTFVANLGTVLAQNGERVIIVDFDMRKPRIEKIFSLDSVRSGIVNYLTSGTPLDILIQQVSANLDVLPVGPVPPNPTALLTSKKVDQLFMTLKERRLYCFSLIMTRALEVFGKWNWILLIGQKPKK